MERKRILWGRDRRSKNPRSESRGEGENQSDNTPYLTPWKYKCRGIRGTILKPLTAPKPTTATRPVSCKEASFPPLGPKPDLSCVARSHIPR